MRSLGDSRILTRRLKELVPVTDNWNAALARATGDYIIMLGDDDALVPGGLSRLTRLIEAWRHPEAIYAQAHQYAYPGVIPGHANPFVQTGYNAFLEGVQKDFELAPAIALDMVRSAMGFYILYGFNMQHFVISRRLVERLKPKGPFFQSPYPDYYAANAVLLTARPLVVTPEPVALIGISPKSFGYYYFNAREEEGVAFLQNGVDSDIAASLLNEFVPGSNMNDSWLCAMQTLARNFSEMNGLRVHFHGYRRLQYFALLKKWNREAFLVLLRHMRWWEFALYGAAALAIAAVSILPGRARARARGEIIHKLFSPAPRFDPHLTVVPHRDILEAARANVP